MHHHNFKFYSKRYYPQLTLKAEVKKIVRLCDSTIINLPSIKNRFKPFLGGLNYFLINSLLNRCMR